MGGQENSCTKPHGELLFTDLLESDYDLGNVPINCWQSHSAIPYIDHRPIVFIFVKLSFQAASGRTRHGLPLACAEPKSSSCCHSLKTNVLLPSCKSLFAKKLAPFWI